MPSETRSDEALVQAYLEGENSAFDGLVERYQPRLIGFALKRLKNLHRAEDAVQETWQKAWQNIRSYDTTRKFSSWLYKICQNQCYMVLRKKHIKLAPVAEDIKQIPEGKGGLREAALDRAAREWCLAVLRGRQRQLYDLVAVQGRTYEAITQQKPFLNNDIESLRQEFAEIMDIVLARSKERIRRDKGK